MYKVRLRRVSIVVAASLTLLTLFACASLKLVTDVMAARAEQLGLAALHTHDTGHLADLLARIENWSRAADYVAWAVGTLVLAGSLVVVYVMYRLLFHPLFDLASAMKRFADGDRHARAGTSASIELATAADNFNEMAGIITGQHGRMIDFLGGAAQELKDPVQVMRQALEPLAPDRPLPVEERTRSRLALLSREVDRLERMVETYLDASKVEWKRLDLQQGIEDVRRLAEKTVDLYQTYSTIHQVSLSVPAQPVYVFCDPDRLSQVFHTLLTDAIAFSPRGGVIEAKVYVEAGEVVFSVTDHGIGISEEDLKTLFEPFHRLGTHPRGPEASVALSVARRIVAAHRGRIEVTSKVGEGSTFRMRLPVAAEPPPGERSSGRDAEAEGEATPAHAQ